MSAADPHPLTVELELVDHAGTRCVSRLSPREFFDDGEDFDQPSLADLVWRHPHAHQYTEHDLATLRSTRVTVSRGTTPLLEVSELYWGDAPNRSILRRDFVGGIESNWLRVVEVATPQGIHFLRFESDVVSPTHLREHTVVLPDESVLAVFPGSGPAERSTE